MRRALDRGRGWISWIPSRSDSAHWIEIIWILKDKRGALAVDSRIRNLAWNYRVFPFRWIGDSSLQSSYYIHTRLTLIHTYMYMCKYCHQIPSKIVVICTTVLFNVRKAKNQESFVNIWSTDFSKFSCGGQFEFGPWLSYYNCNT